MKNTSVKLLPFLLLFAAASFAMPTIYSGNVIRHHRIHHHGPLYVQVGAFANKKNAYQFRTRLRSVTTKPISIRRKRGFYIVVIGPLHSLREVRTVDLLAERRTRVRQVYGHHKPGEWIEHPPMEAIRPVYQVPRTSAWLAGHRTLELSGGVAWAGSGDTQTLYLQPIILKTFVNHHSNKLMGNADLFLGLQYGLSQYFQGQFGLDMGVSSSVNRSGSIWEQGLADFDNYTYSYTMKQMRVGLKGKIISTPLYYQLSPYVSAMAGIGFNRAGDYDSTPRIEEESEQPPFSSKTNRSFTYRLGLGIQRALNQNLSLGMGYEFADLGKMELGRAEGQTMNQGPGSNHLYTNGLSINLSYVG